MEAMRRIREELEWSQAKTARAAGLDPASYNQIETDRRSPKVETLQKIADALGVEVGDFFPKGQAALRAESEYEQRRLRYLSFWTEFIDETAGDIEEWRYAELANHSDPADLPEREFLLFTGGVLRYIQMYERMREVAEGEITEEFGTEPQGSPVTAAITRFERAYRRMSRVMLSLVTPAMEKRVDQLAEEDEEVGERRSNIRSIRNIGAA